MTMPAALVIAGKDLRQRLRDRSALVLGVAAPLLIAGLMSFAFQGVDTFHITVAVTDGDGTELSAALLDVLESPELRDIVTVEPAGAAEEPAGDADDAVDVAAAVDDGDVDAGVVIPAGFAASVVGSEPLPVEVLTSADAPLAGEVTRSIVGAFVAQVDADRLSVATALAGGAPLDQLESLVADAAEQRLPMAAVQRPTGSRVLDPISYYAPAMGIFFVLFAVSFGSRGYFLEQRAGTLERMTAAVRPSEVLLGKALSVFVYAAASLATIAVFTSVLFGADWGGVVPAAILILAMVLAVVCLTAFVTLVARTERQADGVSSIVTFGLALLGGNFVMLASSPPLLRKLALLTPNGWALRGFVDLATGERALATVAEPVAGILAFCAVIALVSALLARRLVRA
jgi:ABC-2 type transport system permease protein